MSLVTTYPKLLMEILYDNIVTLGSNIKCVRLTLSHSNGSVRIAVFLYETSGAIVFTIWHQILSYQL